MPRNKLQNEAMREQSRERILASAMALFAEQGYGETTIRDIARAAGIAQGLLYNYFSGKEEVMLALFAQSMAQVRLSFEAATEGGTPAAQLERLIRRSFEIVQAQQQFWKLSYAVRMQPAVLAGLGGQLDAWIATIMQTLEIHLRAAGVAQPEVEAAILFAQIDGIAQHYVMRPDTYPLAAIVDVVARRYGNLQLCPQQLG